jgi:hypothetical protein
MSTVNLGDLLANSNEIRIMAKLRWTEAKMRGDVDGERHWTEVWLRACIAIGGLSRLLPSRGKQ